MFIGLFKMEIIGKCWQLSVAHLVFIVGMGVFDFIDRSGVDGSRNSSVGFDHLNSNVIIIIFER